MPTAIGDLDVTYATNAVLGRDGTNRVLCVLFVHRKLTANTYRLWFKSLPLGRLVGDSLLLPLISLIDLFPKLAVFSLPSGDTNLRHFDCTVRSTCQDGFIN